MNFKESLQLDEAKSKDKDILKLQELTKERLSVATEYSIISSKYEDKLKRLDIKIDSQKKVLQDKISKLNKSTALLKKKLKR